MDKQSRELEKQYRVLEEKHRKGELTREDVRKAGRLPQAATEELTKRAIKCGPIEEK